MKSKSAARFLSTEAPSPVSETESPSPLLSEKDGFSASLQRLRSALRLHSPSPEVPHFQLRSRRPSDCVRDAATGSVLSLPTGQPAPRSLSQAADTYEVLGDGYMNACDYQQAVNSFHRAVGLAVRPGSQAFRLYYNLCEAYFRMEKYKQAVRFGTQAAIYADQLSSPPSPRLSARLPRLFDFLARAEEALKRFDKAKFWLQRALAQLHPKTGSTPPRRVHLPSRKHMQNGRASVDLTIKPGDLAADNTNGKLTQPNRVSGDWKKLQIKGDLRPADFTLRPSTTRVKSYIPLPEPQALARPLLFECWKRLKLGYFAHIRISESSGDVWLLVVTCNGTDLREQLGSQHPWRKLQPSVLAAQLQLNAKRELVLETPKLTKTFPLELLRESHSYEGTNYEVVFRTDTEISEVEVTAEGGGCSLTKIVVNDINLTTQQDCKAYIRSVLLPSLRISNNRILISVEKSLSCNATPTSGGGYDQSPKPLGVCHTGRRQLSWQSVSTANSTETAITRRRYPHPSREEVYTVQQSTTQREGIVIRFSETESGTTVYQRNYQHLRSPSQDSSPSSKLKSIVIIQSAVRRFLAQRWFKLMKVQKYRHCSRQRLGMVLRDRWYVVTAYSVSRVLLKLQLVDVVSKEVTRAEIEARAQALVSKEACAALLTLREQEVFKTVLDPRSTLLETTQRPA